MPTGYCTNLVYTCLPSPLYIYIYICPSQWTAETVVDDLQKFFIRGPLVPCFYGTTMFTASKHQPVSPTYRDHCQLFWSHTKSPQKKIILLTISFVFKLPISFAFLSKPHLSFCKMDYLIQT